MAGTRMVLVVERRRIADGIVDYPYAMNSGGRIDLPEVRPVAGRKYAAKGRVCRQADCDTILSVFNSYDTCALHTRKPSRHPDNLLVIDENRDNRGPPSVAAVERSRTS